MSRNLLLADRLREWGLDVVEVDGWERRGSIDFAPRGVVLHHTAGASSGDMPSLNVLIHGRSDLPGPLAQVGLARSGTAYVIAGGKASHAGAGGTRGLAGNRSVWGIEAENDGRQAWPAAQLDAMYAAAAALCTLTPQPDAELVVLHREWAPGRKPDPHSIDGAAARARVAGELAAGPFTRRLEKEAVVIVVHPQALERSIPVAGTDRRVYLSTDFIDGAARVAIGGADAAGVWHGTILERVVVPRARRVELEIPGGAQLVSVRWLQGRPITARVAP